MFKYLADKGAEKFMEVIDAQHNTPLMCAAKAGNAEIIEGIIKNYKIDPNVVTDTNALFITAQENCHQAAKKLIELGADVKIVAGERQISPLHIAASNDHQKIVDLLLLHGCEVDCVDSRGFTPLMMASSEGYLDTVKKLVSSGSDVNKRASSSGECPLHMAVRQNNNEVVKFLLENGAISTFEDSSGLTPSQVAQELAKEEKVKAKKEIFLIHSSMIENWGKKVCSRCNKSPEEGKQLKRCGNCKKTVYCSLDCQKLDWKIHSKVCKK